VSRWHKTAICSTFRSRPDWGHSGRLDELM
jgi:hypothetical protein